MVLQLFRPPIDTADLMDCKLGDINDTISLEYEKYFCGVGTFTLEISPASVFADKIAVNTLIYSRDDEICWVAKNIKTESDKITVTGYDLNCLLLDRLTMPTDTGEAGTEDKDAVSGSTEHCVKHFVEYNLVASEMAERNIPHFEIAENLDRGISADTYLASKECLEDVVRTMCARAKLGYRISLITNTSGPGASYFSFDVMEQCDRSADQSERNRVILSTGFKNISESTREVGITADKNALWCDVGGLNGFVNSTDDEIPSDWERREEYASLSVTDPYSQQQVTDAARQEIADKFAATDSLEVDAGNPLDYGTIYNVGDIVTVYDVKRTAQLNSVISAATVKRTATEYTVKLTLGESKPKLLDGYTRQSDLTAKNQREFPVVGMTKDRITNNGAGGSRDYWNTVVAESYNTGLNHLGTVKGFSIYRQGKLNHPGIVFGEDYDSRLALVQLATDGESYQALEIGRGELWYRYYEKPSGMFPNGRQIERDLLQGDPNTVTEEYVTDAISAHDSDESAHEYIQGKISNVQKRVTSAWNSILDLEDKVSDLESGGTGGGVYTTKIAFKESGFDLTFADKDGEETLNEFTIEETNGKITKITNTTAGREIEVTYE